MKVSVITFVLAVAPVLGFSVSTHAEMSSEQATLARLEIRHLVDDYAVYRDSKDAQGYASVFTEDGEFYFRGDLYKGHDALAGRIEAISPNSNTMHVMSTSQVTFLDDSTATGVHYATIYSITTEKPRAEGEVINLSTFAVMGKYNDKYELTEAGWKISERRIEPVFFPAK